MHDDLIKLIRAASKDNINDIVKIIQEGVPSFWGRLGTNKPSGVFDRFPSGATIFHELVAIEGFGKVLDAVTVALQNPAFLKREGLLSIQHTWEQYLKDALNATKSVKLDAKTTVKFKAIDEAVALPIIAPLKATRNAGNTIGSGFADTKPCIGADIGPLPAIANGSARI
jgi:hypothetical protein